MIVDISKDNVVVTGLYQYDFGQTLNFTGEIIKNGTEVHFFQGDGCCRSFANNNVAEIPDYLLASAKTVLAYAYVTDENHGETIKKMTLMILPRGKPPDYVDPSQPADYSRLLPLGGEIGDLLIRTDDGYAWRSFDNEFATDDELQKVSESIPVAMSVKEILSICKI